MPASEVLDKDARKIAKKLEAVGFRFKRGTSQHIRIIDPLGGHAGTLSASPGTPRWEVAGLRSLARKWDVKL